MSEDEARGIVVGRIMKDFPGAKLCAITLMEIPKEDVIMAASWYPTEANGEEHG